MAINGYDDETLGAYGMAPNVPSNTWFPVNTATGEWQLPGRQPSTLASSAGMPDVTSPPVWGGTPDEAPLAIGQVAGTLAPQLGPQPRMQAIARADRAGLLTPQPSVWESIARGIGMASPTGRAILQGFDTQQQQQLTNRLALRRQQMLEEQESRQATQSSLDTFLKISQMPNKSMRNVMFDRYVASLADAGQPLPTDMVEAFKKSSLDEGKQMAQMFTPLFEVAGIDPAAATAYLEEGGDPKRLVDFLDLGLKGKKEQREQADSTQLSTSLGTLRSNLGGASGTTTEPSTAPTTAQPPATPAANVGRPEASSRAPMPIRMNNPLNIKQGRATQKWIDQGVAVPGDEATDGGRFLKFQSPAQGFEAARDLLTGETYKGLTVDAALKKWSSNGYGGEIVTGVDSQKKIADLTPTELRTTLGAMARREGGASAVPDTRMMVAGPGAPAPAAPAPAAPVPAADQAQVQQLNRRIAAMDQFLTEAAGRGGERGKAAVAQVERMRADAVKERDQLLEPQRAAVRKRAEAQVEEEVKGGQTAAEVLGERVTTFFNKDTGEAEDPGQPMASMRQRLGDKKVAVLSTDQSKQLSVLKQLEPVLDGYKRLVEYAYGPKGPLKDFSRQPFETVSAMWDQAAQKDPQLQAMRRSLTGQLQSVVRALGGRGDLNAQELEAATQMLANFDASLGLGLSAGAGIGRGGVGPMVGVKPSISIPDTPETGMRTANELFDLVNKRIGSLLGNPGYARTKLLEIPEAKPVNPDDPRYGFGFVPPEVMEARQQRARQAPPAPAPPPASASGASTPPAAAAAVPPTSGQRALRAMTPAQLRQLPEPLVQTVIANPGMAAGLSPEQNGALMERLNQFEQQGARRGR